MKHFYKTIIFAVLPLLGVLPCISARGQAFQKGSFLVSVSEGYTSAGFSTYTFNGGTDVLHAAHVAGARDPLTIEYGITNQWGIGLNSGTDLYSINPSKYYGFQAKDNKVTAIMGEFTADVNYHFYVTKRLDVSAVGSVGFSSVSFSGNNGDTHYQYRAGGGLVRAGGKVKYYVLKRFGVMGMLSGFSTKCSPIGVKGNTVGDNYTTTLRGYALEFGICYRIIR